MGRPLRAVARCSKTMPNSAATRPGIRKAGPILAYSRAVAPMEMGTAKPLLSNATDSAGRQRAGIAALPAGGVPVPASGIEAPSLARRYGEAGQRIVAMHAEVSGEGHCRAREYGVGGILRPGRPAQVGRNSAGLALRQQARQVHHTQVHHTQVAHTQVDHTLSG